MAEAFLLGQSGGKKRTGNALVTDVLAGKIFSNADGYDLVGTIKNNAGVYLDANAYSFDPGKLVLNPPEDAYYNSGSLFRLSDAQFIGANIKVGVDLWGRVGTFTADADAIAAELISGKKAYVNGALVTGTMVDNGTVNIMPGTSDQAIAAGKHSGSGIVYGDANLIGDNIKYNTTLFEVPGTFTAEATSPIAAADVLSGKIGYVNGAQVVGALTPKMPNTIRNGNFVDTTGWTSVYSTITAADNIVSSVCTGTQAYGYVANYTNEAVSPGDKLYGRVTARVTNADCTAISLNIDGSTYGTLLAIATQSSPVENEWYTVSGVVTSPSDLLGNWYPSIKQSYGSAATAAGKTMQAKECLLINLTKFFGAGNEPTVEQMDAIVDALGWYDSYFCERTASATADALTIAAGQTAYVAGQKITGVMAPMLPNSLLNGSLTTDTTHWVGLDATLSTVSSMMRVTGSGTSQWPIAYNQCYEPVSPGDLLYACASVGVSNDVCSGIYLELNSTGVGDIVVFDSQLTPTNNSWYLLSGIITTPTDYTGDLKPFVCHGYADAATASGKVLSVRYAQLINLTKFFGAGNEPTVAQMDAIISASGWYDSYLATRTSDADALAESIVPGKKAYVDGVRLIGTFAPKLPQFIINGDFDNGTTDWAGGYAAITASGTVLTVTNSGSNLYGYGRPVIVDLVASGHKIYTRAKCKVTNSVCSKIEIFLTGTTGTYTAAATQNNPVQDTVYTVSGIGTENADFTGRLRVVFSHHYADASTANGKIMTIEEPIAIDLTELFGAGNEPSAETMDAILASTGWYDNIVPAYTNKYSPIIYHKNIERALTLRADSGSPTWGLDTTSMFYRISMVSSCTATLYSTDMIDLTPYSKVLFYINAASISSKMVGFASTNTYNVGTSGWAVYYALSSNVQEFDVSALTGSYYFKFCGAYSSGGTAYVNVYSVILLV